MKVDISRSTFLRQNQYRSVRLQQGRVLLDADWNEQVDIDAMRDRILTRDIVGLCGVPEGTGGFQILRESDLTAEQQARFDELGLLPLDDADLLITAGRIYVWGLMAETGVPTSYQNQPHLASPAPPEEGVYAIYLDMWERCLTALERPDLLEPALGGADTTTREQTIWQVRLERLGALGDPTTCTDLGNTWVPSDAMSTGRLQARVSEPAATLDTHCLAVAGGGYVGLENQLYRVEINEPSGSPDGATFVWSRDNGSVATELVDIVPADRVVVLADAGADEVRGFAGAAWIELTDERRVLSGEPGELLEVERVQDDEVRVRELPAGLDMGAFGAGATVRRWDGTAGAETGDFVELEDGVEVQFEDGGQYRTGDYWLVPARSLEGRLVWPQNGAGPAFLPRHGLEHRYCVLAIGSFDGTEWTSITDCRNLFPELTNLPTTAPAQEPAIRVLGAALETEEGERLPLQNDSLVPADILARGLTLECDGPVDRSSLQGKPTMSLTLEMPWPFRGEDQEFFGSRGVVGFTPLRLDGDATASDDQVRWTPSDDAASWLSENLFAMMAEMDRGDRVLARLTLEGNYVWSFPDGRRYVDGETFGRPSEDGRTDLALEGGSGDGRRGGDFKMWFWLVAPEAPPAGLVVAVQVIGNRIVGQVRDTSGNVIPGAQVVARHVQTGQTRATATNAGGNFTFAEMPAGTHVLTASVAGFPDASTTVTVGGPTGPTGPIITTPTDPVVVFPGGPTGPTLPPGGPTGPIVIGPGPGPVGPASPGVPGGPGGVVTGPIGGGLLPGDFGLRLEDVTGIGSVTAGRLTDAGITHPALLIDMSPGELAGRLNISEGRAETIIANAGELFR